MVQQNSRFDCWNGWKVPHGSSFAWKIQGNAHRVGSAVKTDSETPRRLMITYVFSIALSKLSEGTHLEDCQWQLGIWWKIGWSSVEDVVTMYSDVSTMT